MSEVPRSLKSSLKKHAEQVCRKVKRRGTVTLEVLKILLHFAFWNFPIKKIEIL